MSFQPEREAAAADVEVSPLALEFEGEPRGGLTDAQQLHISNVGGAPLKVEAIDVDRRFVVSGEAARVDPGSELVLDVQYRPLDDDVVIGSLDVYTDDPDEPTVEVELTGVPTG